MKQTFTITKETLGKPIYCQRCETVQYIKPLNEWEDASAIRADCGECSRKLASIHPDKHPDEGKFKMDVSDGSVVTFMNDRDLSQTGPKEEIINKLDNIMTDDELEEIERLVREL